MAVPNGFCDATPRGANQVQSAQQSFQQWLYRSVLLTIAIPDSQVPARGIPVRGVIAGETKESVHFQIGNSWEMNIDKSMILMVEEDPLGRPQKQIRLESE
jgi:hypothetical protein